MFKPKNLYQFTEENKTKVDLSFLFGCGSKVNQAVIDKVMQLIKLHDVKQVEFISLGDINYVKLREGIGVFISPTEIIDFLVRLITHPTLRTIDIVFIPGNHENLMYDHGPTSLQQAQGTALFLDGHLIFYLLKALQKSSARLTHIGLFDPADDDKLTHLGLSFEDGKTCSLGFMQPPATLQSLFENLECYDKENNALQLDQMQSPQINATHNRFKALFYARDNGFYYRSQIDKPKLAVRLSRGSQDEPRYALNTNYFLSDQLRALALVKKMVDELEENTLFCSHHPLSPASAVDLQSRRSDWKKYHSNGLRCPAHFFNYFLMMICLADKNAFSADRHTPGYVHYYLKDTYQTLADYTVFLNDKKKMGADARSFARFEAYVAKLIDFYQSLTDNTIDPQLSEKNLMRHLRRVQALIEASWSHRGMALQACLDQEFNGPSDEFLTAKNLNDFLMIFYIRLHQLAATHQQLKHLFKPDSGKVFDTYLSLASVYTGQETYEKEILLSKATSIAAHVHTAAEEKKPSGMIKWMISGAPVRPWGQALGHLDPETLFYFFSGSNTELRNKLRNSLGHVSSTNLAICYSVKGNSYQLETLPNQNNLLYLWLSLLTLTSLVGGYLGDRITPSDQPMEQIGRIGTGAVLGGLAPYLACFVLGYLTQVVYNLTIKIIHLAMLNHEEPQPFLSRVISSLLAASLEIPSNASSSSSFPELLEAWQQRPDSENEYEQPKDQYLEEKDDPFNLENNYFNSEI